MHDHTNEPPEPNMPPEPDNVPQPDQDEVELPPKENQPPGNNSNSDELRHHTHGSATIKNWFQCNAT